jgi:alkanesulfonate monooxygenase SsuD/methylene tetrahydromethanopterin reductase-like flavin-dependent oxidoreductase (luciferase family)
MAAEATDSLRVGTLVLGNDYKHPAVVAKEFASIDVLSDGRVEAGIGAGWMTADYEALGLPYASHGTRIERLGEALAILKGSWGDGPFSLDGRHYTIKDYDGIPKPRRSPIRRSSSVGAGRSSSASPVGRPTSSASTRTSAPARSAPTRCRTRSRR